MGVYAYKARNRRGEVVEDRVEGQSVAAVAAALRRRGLLVIRVREQGVSRREVLSPFGRVGATDLAVFTRQLSTMIGAGLPLARALHSLSEQAEKRAMGDAIGAVRAGVESGASLSRSMEERRDVFPALYVEMVRAGEAGGVLDDVLPRLAGQLENDQELKRKVKSAMTYPVTVLVISVLAAAFMLIFIVPVFARMFEDLGGTLPLPTRVTMYLSELLTGAGGVAILLACGLGAVAGLRWLRAERGRRAWGRFSLRIPLGIGQIVRKVALARFARSLGALTAAGVPILKAMEVTARTAGNPVVEEALLGARDGVRSGVAIHRTLEGESIFPPMVIRMISVGEETGELDAMLARIADFYEAEVDATVRALTSIIEPVMIVLVGAIVGGIILAMYLPMFRVFELIG